MIVMTPHLSRRRLMHRLLLWAFSACITALVTGCGSDNSFRLNGKIENFGTGNLRVVYFADGAIQSVVAPAIDGKFSMTGRLLRPAVARVYTGNGILIGRFAVRPGETVEGTFDSTDPTAFKLDGNDDSKRLTKFISENASLIKNNDSAALNSAIKAFIADNSNRLVSGILMADYFDARGYEAEATELINSLSDDVVTAASLHGLTDLTRTLSMPTDSLRIEPFRLWSREDSEIEINPQKKAFTVLMFTDAQCRTTDSVSNVPANLSRLVSNGSIQIVEIACDSDTASWHESVKASHSGARNDTVRTTVWDKVIRCWTPSPYNIMGLEDIPVAEVPWFVVADSTRQVLYRGPSVQAAKASLSH